MPPDTLDTIAGESEAILEQYDLCDDCLGRCFAKRMRVSSNRILGAKIRRRLGRTHDRCYICRDIFDRLPGYSAKILEMTEPYAFDTFVVGSTLKPSLADRDDLVRSKFRLSGADSIKTAVSRDLARRLARKSRARPDHAAPEMTITANLKDESVQIYARPVFVSGRYTKDSREMPQKQVSCDQCDGRGCRFCDLTGMDGRDSVEGRIAMYLIDRFAARQVRIAWVGGEDRTSRVAGAGRPFFAKVIDPKIRSRRLPPGIALDGIEVKGAKMIPSMPKDPVRFCSTVRLQVDADAPVGADALSRLSALRGASVKVSDRGAAGAAKSIHWLRYRRRGPSSFRMDFEADGGLPIRRFVEADGVSPGVSEILEVPCRCTRFDFEDIRVLQA